MFRLGTCLFVLALLGLIALPAGATVLDFDDLSDDGYGTAYPMPDGYGGFNWSYYFGWIGKEEWVPSGYNNVIEGTAGVNNKFESDVSMDDGLFHFNGVKLGAGWNDGLNIDITGLRDGQEIYSTTVTTDVYGGDFDFGWLNIDELRFSSYGGSNHGYGGAGDHFVMDNFDFTVAPGLPAVALLGAAPLVGAVIRRFRKR
jgi:hypothetical protein